MVCELYLKKAIRKRGVEKRMKFFSQKWGKKVAETQPIVSSRKMRGAEAWWAGPQAAGRAEQQEGPEELRAASTQ